MLLLNAASKEQRVAIDFLDFFVDEVRSFCVGKIFLTRSWQGASHANLTWDGKDLWDVKNSQAGLHGQLAATVPRHGARMYRLSRASLPSSKSRLVRVRDNADLS